FNRTSWGTWTLSGSQNGHDWVRGDFNGDGKDDQIHVGTDCSIALQVLLSNGTAFTKPSWSIANCGTYSIGTMLAADVNGDGKTDILPDVGHNDVHVFLSTGSGFTYQTWATDDGINNGADWVTVDLNGDGKADFVEPTIKNGCKVNGLTSTGTA